MKAIKTRKLLNKLIKQNREIQIGRPITDTEIDQVRKELESLENWNKFLLITLFVATLLAVITNIK
jgi:hypothetical protein